VPDLLEVGGPCGSTVTLTGINSVGAPIDFGGGQTVLTTDLFAVQGARFDGRVQTPLNSSRVTYSRGATTGQIEAFAGRSGRAPLLAVQWHPEWATDAHDDRRIFFHLLGRALRGASPKDLTS